MEIAVTILIGLIAIYTIILFNLISFCRKSHVAYMEIFELIEKKLAAQKESILLLKKNQETQTKMIQSLQGDLFRIPKENNWTSK